jgi:hypothetical protein
MLSRDATLFLMVEVRNEGGVQPATLGSAYDSFKQAPVDRLLAWCEYNDKYSEAERFCTELGLELIKLMRKHGKKTKLEQLIGR